jgi:hypothetical protein
VHLLRPPRGWPEAVGLPKLPCKRDRMGLDYVASDAVRDRLGDGFDQALWLVVRRDRTIEVAAFLSEAAASLPPEPWNETTWMNGRSTW